MVPRSSHAWGHNQVLAEQLHRAAPGRRHWGLARSLAEQLGKDGDTAKAGGGDVKLGRCKNVYFTYVSGWW